MGVSLDRQKWEVATDEKRKAAFGEEQMYYLNLHMWTKQEIHSFPNIWWGFIG